VISAWSDYTAAADTAGVEVRLLDTAGQAEASALWQRIWDGTVLESHLVTALAHSGNYVAGAFAGDVMVGAAAGFFARPLGRTMHSHVAGVTAGGAGRGVGTALKLHQRAWCLDLGLTEMTWTFDPLVARNASFNLTRLGATCDDYLVNHYGIMTDGINAGDESDRIVARWHLDRDLPVLPPTPRADAVPALIADAEGAPASLPLPVHATAVTVALPTDIEDLRRTDPTRALAWRRAVRAELVPRLSAGWTVTAASRETGYLLERAT
jgi:predicted GNAT superfamily acetyltransferase